MNTFLAWFPPNLWGDLFRFHWTFIRVEEEDRYVIGVCYGDVKPGYLMYFVVDKASQEVRGLLAEEAQAYQPAYWR